MSYLLAPRVDLPPDLLAAAGGDELLAHLLYRRGCRTGEEASKFLDWRLYEPVRPFLFPGMREAVAVVERAVAAGRRVCVYGDYDADGVTSAAILVEALRRAGADVTYHIPDRFREGYGLNRDVLEHLAAEGVRLIVTCDTGIAGVEEVAHAGELGMEVVVTDHHQPPAVLPPAAAIVNPKLLDPDHPTRVLAGAGVAFLFAGALLREGEGWPDEFLDLFVLGTIADAVPLTAENRYWVARGLPCLRATRRPGLVALMQAAGIDPGTATEEDVAYQLAPRINAAGRLEAARPVVEMLLTADAARAAELAAWLDRVNARRRELCELIGEEAEACLEDRNAPAIVLFDPHWHEGVIGIVAGRLAERYSRPAFLLTTRAEEEVAVGSARAGAGVSVYDVLAACADELVRFGGHEAAAGFAVEPERIPRLASRIQAVVGGRCPEAGGGPVADWELSLDAVRREVYEKVQLLAPFGAGNPAPVFVTRGVSVLAQRPTLNGKHLRLVVGREEHRCSAIWWSAPRDPVPAADGVDVLYELGLDRWQGEERLELIVRDIVPSAAVAAPAAEEEWLDLRGGDPAELLRTYPDAVFYHEGGPAPAGVPVSNRYGVKAAPTLVLLAIPPDPAVLREIVALANARRIVLGYGDEPRPDVKVFLKTLLGMAKYALNRHAGVVDLGRMAAALGELEGTVYYGLLTLVQAGALEVSMQEHNRVLVKKGPPEHVPPEAARAGTLLRKLLGESSAFRRFCLQAPAADIAATIFRQR
ncbi:MAG: single-stranded-DNA-specific exonuclease RecJ [Desulfotomaculales bacterium]